MAVRNDPRSFTKVSSRLYYFSYIRKCWIWFNLQIGLHNIFRSCAKLAQHAFHEVAIDNELFQQVFQTSEPDKVKLVQENYRELWDRCNTVGSRDPNHISLTCHDIKDSCERGDNGNPWTAYGMLPMNNIVICPLFFSLPATTWGPMAASREGILLHEMAHIVAGT